MIKIFNCKNNENKRNKEDFDDLKKRKQEVEKCYIQVTVQNEIKLIKVLSNKEEAKEYRCYSIDEKEIKCSKAGFIKISELSNNNKWTPISSKQYKNIENGYNEPTPLYLSLSSKDEINNIFIENLTNRYEVDFSKVEELFKKDNVLTLKN